MTIEDTAKLRALVAGPLWQPLISKMRETVDDLLRRALNAESKEEAETLLHDARAAQSFMFSFTKAVETDAQGE